MKWLVALLMFPFMFPTFVIAGALQGVVNYIRYTRYGR